MAGHILFVGKLDSRLERTWSSMQESGHQITCVRSRKPALRVMRDNPPVAVVVDLTVLRTGAERLCHTVKKHRPSTPILLLVDDEQPPPKLPHDRTMNRAAGYRRFNSTLSRLIEQSAEQSLAVGSLRLNLASRTVQSEKGMAVLCPREAELLEAFMRYPGRVLKHRFLMKAVWDTDFTDDLGTLWTHISALRSKIEPYPHRRVYLHTVRGVGYRLDVWPSPAGE